MVGGVERSFGTSVPFLIILYTKKIKNQGVLRKKSNTRSYFFEISQPSRICAVASPVFYFTFILYLFGEGVAPTKNAGSTLGTVQEKKSFPRSRRRVVRRSPVAGAAPPHFRPARAKSGGALKKRLRRFNRHSAGITSCYNTSLLLELKCQPKHIRYCRRFYIIKSQYI